MRQLQRIPWAVLVFVAAAACRGLARAFIHSSPPTSRSLRVRSASLNLCWEPPSRLVRPCGYSVSAPTPVTILMKTYGGRSHSALRRAASTRPCGPSCSALSACARQVSISAMLRSLLADRLGDLFQVELVTGGEQGFNNVPITISTGWQHPILGDLRTGDRYYSSSSC